MSHTGDDAEPVDAAWESWPVSQTPQPGAPSRTPMLADRLRDQLALAGLDLGRRGVKALCLVAMLVVVGAALLAWCSMPRAQPVPVGLASPPATVSPVSGGSSMPGPSLTGVIVVAVSGRVRHPGLVRLPAGARVADAIDAAGGALPGTDLSLVNLARKLSDGELVLIGVTPPPGVAIGTGDPSAAPALVNLNTASLTELEALPGVGPALGQHIIDYRTAHGGFHSVSDLRQVLGIGDAKFAQLKDLVTV